MKNKRILPKKKNPLMLAAKSLLLVLTAIYPMLMVILSGAGLVYNSTSYGAEITRTGVFLIASGLMMTAGAVLCMFKKSLPNLASLFCSVIGFVICMMMLNKLTAHADRAGWMDNFNMTPISDMYRTRIIPVIAPFLLTVVISLVQYFSYDASEERREKKRRREAEKNAPSPPIVDEQD